jgi:hypothetical protein
LYIQLFNLLLEKQGVTYRRIESSEKPENMSTDWILAALITLVQKILTLEGKTLGRKRYFNLALTVYCWLI